jgi:hypothetical protein
MAGYVALQHARERARASGQIKNLAAIAAHYDGWISVTERRNLTFVTTEQGLPLGKVGERDELVKECAGSHSLACA